MYTFHIRSNIGLYMEIKINHLLNIWTPLLLMILVLQSMAQQLSSPLGNCRYPAHQQYLWNRRYFWWWIWLDGFDNLLVHSSVSLSEHLYDNSLNMSVILLTAQTDWTWFQNGKSLWMHYKYYLKVLQVNLLADLF